MMCYGQGEGWGGGPGKGGGWGGGGGRRSQGKPHDCDQQMRPHLIFLPPNVILLCFDLLLFLQSPKRLCSLALQAKQMSYSIRDSWLCCNKHCRSGQTVPSTVVYSWNRMCIHPSNKTDYCCMNMQGLADTQLTLRLHLINCSSASKHDWTLSLVESWEHCHKCRKCQLQNTMMRQVWSHTQPTHLFTFNVIT